MSRASDHGRWDGAERCLPPGRRDNVDPATDIAVVAVAKRAVLLRAHRYRLRWQDLEDCYSQATLELLAHVRRGGTFADARHVSNALEQRFVSRIYDRRRALGGRSPTQATLETAVSLDSDPAQLEPVDERAELESLVLLREQLRLVQELARELTPDQRLVLACQVGLQMSRAEFCARYGWSGEKYRKVAQRARTRLRRVVNYRLLDVPSEVRESE
jgi:DNA-directed RNA polymerase specialized sigma24 family protein